MNKWQQIWERRRDNLQHIDANDTRAVFDDHDMIAQFAARHALKIRFDKYKTTDYINAAYTYHCFMERS